MSSGGGVRPERILVLSGGGGRGAYQVGACEVLYESGWRPDVILGNSIGATNGAILAAPRSEGAASGGVEPVRLLKRAWLDEIAGNKLHQVSAEWPAFLGLLVRWALAVAQRLEKPPQPGVAFGSAGAEEALLDELVDSVVEDLSGPGQSFGLPVGGAMKRAIRGLFGRVERTLVDVLTRSSVMERRDWAALLERHVDLERLNGADGGCPCLGVTAVQAATGELGYAWNRVPPGVRAAPGVDDASSTITVDHLMASSSIPGIYPSTAIGPAHWWDGALAANTPIAPAIDVLLHHLPERTEIVAVLMTPYDEATVGAGPPPTVLDALRRFLDWMLLAALHRELGRLAAEQRAWVTVIAPRELMGVVQIIDYGQEDVEALIGLGREDARRALGG